MFKKSFIAAALALLVIVPAPAAAVEPPYSFAIFCGLNPSECVAYKDHTIHYTPSLTADLRKVNERVNRSIHPKLDSVFEQVWRINPRSGDCKSYAVSKRHELIKMGYPPGAIRIGVGIAPDGQRHAVTLVKSDAVTFVLDNLTNEIHSTGTTGVKIQIISGANPMVWSRF
jgi:predicted transglutaminase-like cysteine proteinase